MSDASSTVLHEDAELILGLVAPVGTNFDRFVEILRVHLKDFNYDTNLVRLSELASSFKVHAPEPTGTEEFVRLTRLMNAGNSARTHGGDLLALAAAAKISSKRTIDESRQREPLARTAHIIRSLKHPGEVHALRRIYGPGFFLIGVVSSPAERRRFLKERRGCTEEEVDKLFARDDHEGETLGQRTRDTFHLADVFLDLDDAPSLERFLNLVFANPYETPSRDEYAMFLAFSAALRSADLSRQVGAVLMSEAGDVVAIGTNDVPAPGGGLYWPGKGDHRDHVLGRDTNETQRKVIVDEVLSCLGDVANETLARLGQPPLDMAEWRKEGWRKLKDAAVMDITEYGRAVHAEMEALLACARSGISPRKATLFSTTFPCHNCAKHIIAAGVGRVVYVEPYPKSHAATLYERAISLEGAQQEGTVVFEPFRGVGPRRFFDLFSIGLSSGYTIKRKRDGMKRAWEPGSAAVRVPLSPASYITREEAAAERLDQVSRDEESSK